MVEICIIQNTYNNITEISRDVKIGYGKYECRISKKLRHRGIVAIGEFRKKNRALDVRRCIHQVFGKSLHNKYNTDALEVVHII